MNMKEFKFFYSLFLGSIKKTFKTMKQILPPINGFRVCHIIHKPYLMYHIIFFFFSNLLQKFN